MGNGASQSLQGRHSDSRISALRLDNGDVVVPVDSARSNGNNTVTLRLNHFHEYVAVSTDTRKPRARSLPGSDATAAAAAELAAASSHALQVLEEGREDHNSSASSLVAENNNAASPRAGMQSDDSDHQPAYDDEVFEEDTIEWKQGEALGSGSYGTVYLARNERSGALMAVKEIVVAEESEVDVRNAKREVELLRSLRHENVVKYLGSHVDYAARKLFIFTEWVPGGNLEQNRKRFGGGERVVRRFTQQILRGVAYLHSKRVVHHDIKPTNLLVDQSGVVKLADFGSSRLMSTTTVVNNESLRGTPNYMAPEVIKQSGPRSAKSDIWSVGCSVLRLLTGLPLWGDKQFDSQIALLYFIAHLEQLPPLPAELSADAQSFLHLCLEIDPARRPSAEELLAHPFVGGTGAFPTLPSPSSPSSPSSSFLLPSRSTLLALPPLKAATDPHSRGSTAPAPAPKPAADASPEFDIGSPRTRHAPSSAPASVSPSSSTASSSKSQLVSTRFPSRGLFDDRVGTATLPSLRKASPHDSHAPETLSIRSKTAQRSSRTLESEAASIPSCVVDDESDVYSYSDFAETVPTAYTWEDQPILTDAARADRERQLARAAEEKRKKEERERQFQEELVEFRRHALQQPR